MHEARRTTIADQRERTTSKAARYATLAGSALLTAIAAGCPGPDPQGGETTTANAGAGPASSSGNTGGTSASNGGAATTTSQSSVTSTSSSGGGGAGGTSIVAASAGVGGDPTGCTHCFQAYQQGLAPNSDNICPSSYDRLNAFYSCVCSAVNCGFEGYPCKNEQNHNYCDGAPPTATCDACAQEDCYPDYSQCQGDP
jgi:hypothetical protein